MGGPPFSEEKGEVDGRVHEREVGRRDCEERREGKCGWLGND